MSALSVRVVLIGHGRGLSCYSIPPVYPVPEIEQLAPLAAKWPPLVNDRPCPAVHTYRLPHADESSSLGELGAASNTRLGATPDVHHGLPGSHRERRAPGCAIYAACVIHFSQKLNPRPLAV